MVSVITKTVMSYYRNRPLFGSGPGFYGGPPRTPKSQIDRRPAPGLRTSRRPVDGIREVVAPGPPAGAPRELKVEDLASEREPNPTAVLEAEIARLRGLLADKERTAREASVRTQIADDEIERAKLRIEKDARKDLERRTRSFLLSFLDVVDDLDRAIAAAGDEERDSPMLCGVELVRKGFLDKLARHEVAHQPVLGERFDPARHEAVGMVPVDSAERDGLIVGVVREGYTIGEDTLRPASVAVGRYRGPE